jgi:hypothetical protein
VTPGVLAIGGTGAGTKLRGRISRLADGGFATSPAL